MGSDSSPGRLLHYVKSVYPPEARTRRIQGVVTMRATIGKSGEVRGIEVINGDPLLVSAAVDAVKQWRYSPFMLNDQPVEIKIPIDVSFNSNQ